MTHGPSVYAAWALALALTCAVSAARPGEAVPAADDPQLEARVQRVAEELRCLVCQNQTIADSNADLAKDLRAEVRRLLAQGGSEAEVREFMVHRYGDFILYRPPLKATTLTLWVGPFALLALALWVHRRSVARRERSAAAATLTEAEQARLRVLVGSDQGPERG
jgi:cytochrome c-type biogenesis protein CcmH